MSIDLESKPSSVEPAVALNPGPSAAPEPPAGPFAPVQFSGTIIAKSALGFITLVADGRFRHPYFFAFRDATPGHWQLPAGVLCATLAEAARVLEEPGWVPIPRYLIESFRKEPRHGH